MATPKSPTASAMAPATTSGTTEWEDYNAANGLAFSGTGVHDCGHIYPLGSQL
ncbi:MAG: hypothetical protein JRN56_02795 [Nitrososphaerota archaeon]|nr:hypothetical protein [Nitrososphaerota archaeon]MDG6912555.1 hypothetical protein [Nitrososphaerota archaeon]MDG6962047.1 hypothetical protein [Nitrososphaerota archaeon]MDG6972938.1 hypothetical protein [Nitrososphaerota archaeon]MDG6980462.1 hypothetical protein [Nitrososphaerota archaeon]